MKQVDEAWGEWFRGILKGVGQPHLECGFRILLFSEVVADSFFRPNAAGKASCSLRLCLEDGEDTGDTIRETEY